jgi:hypothetical protein
VQEPPDAAAEDLAAAAAALACGDWPEARAHFERSLSTSESPVTGINVEALSWPEVLGVDVDVRTTSKTVEMSFNGGNV